MSSLHAPTGASAFPLESLDVRILQTATPVGVNIEGVSDYARSFTFADAMKSARHFGSVNAPWDQSAPVDAHGWPVGDAGATIIVADTSSATPISIDGTYRFSARGHINVTPVASNAYVTNWNYDDGSDTTTADVVVLPGATQLHLDFTGDPDGAKDIHLYRPGTYDGQTFTNEFLQSLQNAQSLRLMDFLATNSTTVENWSDRTTPADATQATTRGAAWEYAIELANTLNKDLWINIPVSANDDYVRNLAQLFRDSLYPGLNVYVEYSNEVWNGSFPQFGTNYQLAQNDMAADPSDLNYDHADNTYQYAWRRVAKRLIEIRDLFASVYGDQAVNDTIRPVLASQIGWSFVLKDQLDYLEHRFGPDLSRELYAVAGAPYMSIGDTLSSSSSLTVDQIFLALNDNLQGMQTGIQKYEALSTEHRLHYLYYEGGIDLTGDSGGNFARAKLPANYDPRMYDLVKSFLVNAFNNGADQVMYYSQISTYTPWGTWGLTDSIQQLDAPKFNAFNDVTNSETPAITSGITLPDFTGAVSVDAGSFLLDKWANNGNGGAIYGTYGGATYHYLLNVTSTSNYLLQLAAGTPYTDGRVEIFIDGQSLGVVTLPATSGLDAYAATLPLALSPGGEPLSIGHHTLQMKVLSGYFNVKSLTLATADYVPPAPATIVATARGYTQIQLTWNDVVGESGYLVERSSDNGATWTRIDSLPLDTITYTDSTLAPGTSYSYRVRAINTLGSSLSSDIASATTFVPLPVSELLPAPTNLAAAALSPTSIELTWTGVTDAASYLIQRAQGGKGAWTSLTRVSRRSAGYIDYGLSSSTSYSYRILAVALDGTLSDASSVVTARTRKK